VAATEGVSRRATILAVAAELFAAKGVSATSVREIAQEVGILSGSLYHHFGSKDDLVQEIVLSYLEDLLAQYDEIVARDLPPVEALEALVRASLATVQRHPFATEIYQNDAAHLRRLPRGEDIAAAGQRVPETWLGVIDAGVAAGDFRDDIPARIFYNMLRDALWRCVQWFDPERGHDWDQLGGDFLAVFLDGFATRR
jgi:TetR/AcrR family transcriptional regulator, cholesterol catabolism regulator